MTTKSQWNDEFVFPSPNLDLEGKVMDYKLGISLRDLAAVSIASRGPDDNWTSVANWAEWVWECADALLEKRTK